MRRPILLFLFCIILLSIVRTQLLPENTGEYFVYAGQTARAEGVVTNVKIKNYYATVIVNTGSEKILVKLPSVGEEKRTELYSLVGRRVSFTGEFSVPQGRRNPLCFDYRLYLKSRGINTICATNRFKLKGGKTVRPLLNILSVSKARFYNAVSPYLPEDSFSMLAGIMFGETFYMDEDVYGEFRSNGIAHVLAVSGLHVNLAYEAISRLFKGKRNKKTDGLSLVLIYIYAALANFSVSVLRASFMLTLRILAFYLQRRYDSVSAASLVAGIFLLINPYMLFDSGLQLSFAASYAIGIALPWLSVKLAKIADRLKSDRFYKASGILAPAAAAMAGTAPLATWHYLTFSWVSLLLNPIVIALAGILLPLGLTVFLLFLLLPKAAIPICMYLGAEMLDGLFGCMKLISRLGSILAPNSECVAPPLGALILYYLFFFFFFSETRYVLHRKNRYAELLIIESGMLLSGSILPWAFKFTSTPVPWSYGRASVTFVDVGQGDCIHISKGKINVLIDGGGSYFTNVAENTLKPYLLKNGIKSIDLAIVTHQDQDHAKGIYQLAEIFDVKEMITNDNVYGKGKGDENDRCLILSANVDGLDFLFMADAGFARESALITQIPDLRCDVIKIGHHGSAYSTGEEFINSVSPSFAAISVGAGNSYGHPAPRVIELLEKSGIIYARTDQSGAICLRKVRDNYFVFENAARDKKWLIQRKTRENTLQGQ